MNEAAHHLREALEGLRELKNHPIWGKSGLMWLEQPMEELLADIESYSPSTPASATRRDFTAPLGDLPPAASQ